MERFLKACLLLSWLVPSLVFAAAATSTNFTIDTNVFNTGGGLNTSTNFSLQNSVGQPAISISSSSGFLVKGEFLYFPSASSTQSPNAPSGLTATLTATTQVTLGWTDNSNNEDGFSIERKAGSGGTYSEIVRTGSNITAYADNSVVQGNTYRYRVRAFAGTVYSTYSNEASVTLPPSSSSGGTIIETGGGSGGGVGLYFPPKENGALQCSLDFNADRHVDIVDLSILLYHYGQSTPTKGWCYDPANDGTVDFRDISILMYHWTG